VTADVGVARRECSMPDCPAWYDAIAVAGGARDAAGWRRWNSLGLLLCPEHSPLWDVHAPSLVRHSWDSVDVACGCGWRADVTGRTGREAARLHVGHLVGVVVSGG